RQRFLREHVKPCTRDRTVLQTSDECVLVDHASTGNINQPTVFAEQFELPISDQVMRRSVRCDRDDDKITDAANLIKGQHLHSNCVCHSRAVGAIIGDDIGAEGAHHSCSLFADTPEPDYTDDGSIKSAPPMLVTFRPAPGAD